MPNNESLAAKRAAALAYLGPKWVLSPARRVTKKEFRAILNQTKGRKK